MKQKKTLIKPDGTKLIYEVQHDSPSNKSGLASQGQRGDTELAHVNPWEKKLLQMAGGVGTRNPLTGLRQYYTDPKTGIYTETEEERLAKQNNYWGDELNNIYSQLKTSGGSQSWGSGTVTAGDGGLVYKASGGGSPIYLSPGTSAAGVNRVATQGKQLADLVAAGGGMAPDTWAVKEYLYKNQNPTQAANWNTSNAQAKISGMKTTTPATTTTSGMPTTTNAGTTQITNPNTNYIPASATTPTKSTTATQQSTTGQQTTATTPVTTGVTTGTQTTATTPATTTGNQVTATANPYANSTLASDYAGYFANVPAGQTMDWAGGKITKNADGTATYMDASGVPHTLSANSSLSDLYSIPGIKAEWDKAYGGTAATNQGTTAETTGSTDDFFNFPTDIMPSSTSTSTSGSQSFSGLPTNYSEQLLSGIIPALTKSAANLEGNIDANTQAAIGTYYQEMQQMLKENVPKALANLSTRGIINSTEGQKILANVASTAATDFATKGYEAMMTAAQEKAKVPSTLASIAQLGQSSTGSSTGTSYSYQSDPTAMYQIMANILQQMM